MKLKLQGFIKAIPDFIAAWANKTTQAIQYLKMRGLEYWYVTDFEETFYAIPVVPVWRNESRRILTVWELEDGSTHEYWIEDLKELYESWEEAHNEARRRNNQNGAGGKYQ